jgi:exodeoxyribonuclease V beta subunit
MTVAGEFDILRSPLEGTNLIEASAGTGKTYTIAALFLRLILEKHLGVDEILVVTFTEAATGEVKDQIRKKLREGIEILTQGSGEDAFLVELMSIQEDARMALDALWGALRAFDRAAIFTIHGFCRKILHEDAFETGSLFDTELVADEEFLKRQVVEDFWRRHLYTASLFFVHYALDSGFSPENLLSLVSSISARPYLRIIPEVEVPNTRAEEEAFQQAFSRVRKTWPSARSQVEDILSDDEGLNRNKYNKVRIPLWIRAMDECMGRGIPHPALFEGFRKFTTSELHRSVKKNGNPVTHPFFDLCEDLQRAQEALIGVFEQRLLGLKISLFREVSFGLSKRKEEKNVQSFDDLLIKVHEALRRKGGPENLAEAVRSKFRAAMIDEFQDTDPIQWGIFRAIFGTEESILMLIGDPKQAIYGFRGADIFAYMEASRSAEKRYTLSRNWRSEPRLIRAVNAVFSGPELPFVYENISFLPALPAEAGARESLLIDGCWDPPFKLWFLSADRVTDSGKPVTKAQARDIIPRAVAGEISRLLNLAANGKASLEGRPLRESDLAVLVRRNTEARLVQESLSALRIPSVLYSTGNLFDTHEAMELERLLMAISEPGDGSLLKAALSTDMMGLRGEDLEMLLEDEDRWEAWLIRFRTYHDLWNERGFIRMFRDMLRREGVQVRLLAFPDGERRNTNIIHLSEALHRISVERGLGMGGLLKWLAAQRDPASQRLQEHELRLESDEKAVKVVTVHKSKGLEYPVVFCPFTWDGSRLRRSKDPVLFHDRTCGMRLTLDLGSEFTEENLALAEEERLAENLRLLYVALTRARNRCYLVWGRFNEAETSAPAYLLHQPQLLGGPSVTDAAPERFEQLGDRDTCRDLKRLSEKCEGVIDLIEMPLEPPPAYSPEAGREIILQCRQFSGKLGAGWRIFSFSSLTSRGIHGEILADRDALDQPVPKDPEAAQVGPAPEPVPLNMSALPRGAKTGSLLHEIFEQVDFTWEDAGLKEDLVVDKLSSYGFERAWKEPICQMIQKVLHVPLKKDTPGFCLSRIPQGQRLNELEFYFPLKSVSPERLGGLFSSYGSSLTYGDISGRIGGLEFSPARGFMKGFIDLIFSFHGRFYLVDWKSNFLGSAVEDYGQDALKQVMEEKFYILQYHIYTLALNQYLRLRVQDYDYEKHFGCVYYIFLRGVDPEKGSDFGIYRDRPAAELVHELRENLIGNP